MLPTSLARFRYIADRLFAEPHCAIIDFACGQCDPSRERFATQLARLLGHALRAGPLAPILGLDLRAELRSLDTVGGFYRIEIDWLRWNWFDGSSISGIKPTESNRYAAALQQGWPGPLPTVAAPLIKAEFGFLPHQPCRGHPCPGSGYDVPTASMPSGTLGMNREPRIEFPLEHGLDVQSLHPSIMCPGDSTRLLIIRRSSSPSRRRTRGPPETALSVPTELASIEVALSASGPCIGERPFPSGRPARYGIVRPTDYKPCIGTITDGSGFDCFDRVALRFAVRSCLPIPYRHPWRPPLSWRRHP